MNAPTSAVIESLESSTLRCLTFAVSIKYLAFSALFFTWTGTLCSQTFTDPGFEDYSLNSGDFLKPSSGVWKFGNDAGVVEPYSPNSSTEVLNTWSATFSAMQGQQYASTYAGSDTIRQSVSFSAAGDYLLSVHAAAADGAVMVFPMASPQPLTDGEFTFTLNNTPIGDLHTIAKGSNWGIYTAAFTIDKPGNYWLGVWNTKTDSYFINYDAFAVQPVPEPSSLCMMLAFAVAACGMLPIRCRRRGR